MPYSYLAKTSQNSYEDLVNSNGAQRYYKVTAVDKDDLESLKQDEPVLGQTLGEPSAPKFNGASFDGSAVNLSWSGVNRASSYTLYKESPSGEAVINDISGTSYVDTNIKAGETYEYKVVAVDEFGIGSEKSDKIEVSAK